MRKAIQCAGHYVRHDGYYKSNKRYKRQTHKVLRRQGKKHIAAEMVK